MADEDRERLEGDQPGDQPGTQPDHEPGVFERLLACKPALRAFSTMLRSIAGEAFAIQTGECAEGGGLESALVNILGPLDSLDRAERLAGAMFGPRDGALALGEALAQQLVACMDDGAMEAIDLDGDGSLLAEDPDFAIEVWTERELMAMHLLLNRAVINRDVIAMERVARAARWHAENIQPDNATGRPWAAHAFFAAHLLTGDPVLAMHADTITHNARVTLASSRRNDHPDLLRQADLMSALILLDGASALELLAG